MASVLSARAPQTRDVFFRGVGGCQQNVRACPSVCVAQGQPRGLGVALMWTCGQRRETIYSVQPCRIHSKYIKGSFFPLQAQHSPRSRCKPTKSARLGSNTSPQPKTHDPTPLFSFTRCSSRSGSAEEVRTDPAALAGPRTWQPPDPTYRA